MSAFILKYPVKSGAPARAGRKRYSPQFSEIASVSVKRLSWALNMPMTEALDHIIDRLPSFIDGSQVCKSCKDNSRCATCVFIATSTNPAILAELAAN